MVNDRRFPGIHSGPVPHHLMHGLIQIRHKTVVRDFKQLHPIGYIHKRQLTDCFRSPVHQRPDDALHAPAIKPDSILLK